MRIVLWMFPNFAPHKRGAKEALIGTADNCTLQKLGASGAMSSAGVQHWRGCLPCPAETGIWESSSCHRNQVLEVICVAGMGCVLQEPSKSTLNQVATPLFPTMFLQCSLPTAFNIITPTGKGTYLRNLSVLA